MKNTSERIGLNLDFAWMLDAGFDPLDQFKKLADHVKIIHLKDFVFDRAGRFEDVVVGTGNVDLAKLDVLLSEVGFEGTAVLEYEGNSENPMSDLSRCVEKIKSEMSFWSWS
ncbi:MAG: sugar phosphate isomerase/epimerase, partial [Planctomycetota bacterium]